LSGLKRLEVLELGGNQITDKGMKTLQGLTNLRRLSLWDTKVTDTGLKQLKGINNLARLDLKGTQVTAAGEKEIKKALPNLELGEIQLLPDWYKTYCQQQDQKWHLQFVPPPILPPQFGRRNEEPESPPRAGARDQGEAERVAIVVIAFSFAGCVAVIGWIWMAFDIFRRTEGGSTRLRVSITVAKVLGIMLACAVGGLIGIPLAILCVILKLVIEHFITPGRRIRAQSVRSS
jgi:hypothetical protein